MTLPASSNPRGTAAARRQRDPFHEMEDVYDRMGQLMQGFFGDMPSVGGVDQPPVWVPLADIEELDDAFIIDLELPGVQPDEIELELRDNQLRIFGEVREKERRGILRRKTRQVGRFEYVVTLPSEVDPDQVEASLAEGVLTIRVGKATTGRPRHIPVRGTGAGSGRGR
ncbi:MAG: heat shock protein Hsp20 [Streptosporangiaceae bacterium]|jgi:HSP20 family protein|nr:heat shock protein Hsp20 [Streptosporangiaceae bacterium]